MAKPNLALAVPAVAVAPEDRPALTLSASQVAVIRTALIIGLESFGEIERLVREFDFWKENAPPAVSGLMDDIRPRHSTGIDEIVPNFGIALRALEIPRLH